MASTICTNGKNLESHACSHNAAHESHKPTTKHTKTWSGLEINFTENVKEISIINLSSHRRRDRKSQITPLKLSQRRALNGQFLRLGIQCLPLLWTRFVKLARNSPVWTNTPLTVDAHHSLVVVTVHRCWGGPTRPDGTSQARQLVLIAIAELLQEKESNMSVVSWHSSRQKRVARSSSAAETQAAAADGDEHAVYTRLCQKEVLFGQLDWQNRQTEARQIPTALVVDRRGVYDALARSASSCLVLKDKKNMPGSACSQTKSGWCPSVAQLGDVVTKDSDVARAPQELFVRRGCWWKSTHHPKFKSSRNRAKCGLDILAEPDVDAFAVDIPRDPKSVALIM